MATPSTGGYTQLRQTTSARVLWVIATVRGSTSDKNSIYSRASIRSASLKVHHTKNNLYVRFNDAD